ncbi:MAG TPA: cysteine peptidase family C39 domain-containing protein [Kofleriaceae bacterium]|nr:cysteine peptidase family C39 domain-containing protein [Kofleriaceae bacterium]
MNKAPRATFSLLLVGLLGLVTACRLNYAGGAKAMNPVELDDSWQRAATTPIVKQESRMDCGLAALAMVAGAWGHDWTLDQLQRDLPPSQNGVKLGALRDYARAKGLQAYAIKGTREDLARELSNGRPVLLGLMLPFDRKQNLAHYEVAVAINRKDGSVVTLDPATGKHMQRSRAVLDLEWKHAGYATLVVVGDQTARKDPRVGAAQAIRAGP